MLKKLKLAVLSAADATGMSAIALKTNWRKQKLLILCYHGISLEDEHEWNGGLYMSPALLRRRFEHLKKSGCNVLPLSDAIRRLYAGELPPRAVAITFDDGFYDFYAKALPLANEFGFPLTVYLTTYYSYFNRPVFDPALNYILWKGRGQRLQLPGVVPDPLTLNDDSVGMLGSRLYEFVAELGYGGEEKNDFLQKLAGSLRVDFDAMCAKRLLHLMTPMEVAAASAAGTDVELHTHRHRVSRERQQFEREIRDNRERIETITGKSAEHFCFPSGFFLPEYSAWLKELKVVSATTCIPGIATRASSSLLLPRLVDTASVTDVEFGGWVSGLASLLPQRKFVMDTRSYLAPAPAPGETRPGMM